MTVQPRNPEALARLQQLTRSYFLNGDMTAPRSEIVEATWDAYPLTDAEREQLRHWGCNIELKGHPWVS